MEWYHVRWPWLAAKCVTRVCQHQLSFLLSVMWTDVSIGLEYFRRDDSRFDDTEMHGLVFFPCTKFFYVFTSQTGTTEFSINLKLLPPLFSAQFWFLATYLPELVIKWVFSSCPDILSLFSDRWALCFYYWMKLSICFCIARWYVVKVIQVSMKLDVWPLR